MTQAPPGYHVVKEHIRRNPGPRRRAKASVSVGGGLVAAAVVGVVMVALVGGIGDAGEEGAKPDPATGAPAAAGAPAAPGTAAAGEPGAPAAATAYARQRTLLVRAGPALNARVVAEVAYDAPVTLMCHTTGPSVYGFNGRATRLWDKITTADGTTGYVSDGWVLTTDIVDKLIPAC